MHMYAYRYLYHKCCPSPAQLPDFKESSSIKHPPKRGGKKSLPSRKSIVIFWTLKKGSTPWLRAVTFWLLPFSSQEADAAETSLAGRPAPGIRDFHGRDRRLSPSALPRRGRRGASEAAAAQDCSSSINRSGCTSSLVTFRLLTDAQLPASLRYRKILPVHPDSQRQKTRFVGRDSQLEPRERRFPPKSRRKKNERSLLQG